MAAVAILGGPIRAYGTGTGQFRPHSQVGRSIDVCERRCKMHQGTINRFSSDMSMMDVYDDKRIILTSALRCRIGVLLITICVCPNYQCEVLYVCLAGRQYLWDGMW